MVPELHIVYPVFFTFSPTKPFSTSVSINIIHCHAACDCEFTSPLASLVTDPQNDITEVISSE